jgi:hypothetical protein
MKKYLLSIASYILAITTLTSCLGEDDSFTYYNDTAITNFSLGTLNRYLHKIKADGTDSIYKRTLNCAGYAFNIDHNNGLIWNTDSLPMDIDASKVICNITTKNSGSIGLKNINNDSLTLFSSRDSIDFTQPRDFYIYSNYGTGMKKYTIKVNVHKEKADTCIWTQVLKADPAIAALTEMKALSDGKKIYLFGSVGTETKLYTTAITDGRTWTEVATTPALTAEAVKSVLIKQSKIYTISGGKLLSSEDGAGWTTIASTDLKQLAAASTANIYALSADNKLMSSADNGATWQEEALDDDAALLPTEDLSFACRKLRTNDNTDKLVIIGNRNAADYAGDTTAMVWTKVDEYGSGARNNPWNYVNFSDDSKWKAPRAKNWQIANYDEGNIKAITGNSLDGSIKALSQIYNSADDGITWINDSVMSIPKDLSSSETSFTMTADGAGSLWIICGGTGQVWKARINRVAWREEQKYFK